MPVWQCFMLFLLTGLEWPFEMINISETRLWVGSDGFFKAIKSSLVLKVSS